MNKFDEFLHMKEEPLRRSGIYFNNHFFITS